mgnify:CR=1 FL=1
MWISSVDSKTVLSMIDVIRITLCDTHKSNCAPL